MGFLFDGFIGCLDAIADTIEYGPFEAIRINTSAFPHAERDMLRVSRNLNNSNMEASKSNITSEHQKKETWESGKKWEYGEIPGAPSLRSLKTLNGKLSKKLEEIDREEIIDEAVAVDKEEEIINKAIAEKGCW